MKNFLTLLIASLVVVFFKHELAYVMDWMLSIHDHVISLLGHIFSHGKSGMVVLSVLTLLLIPILVGVVVGGVYWMVRRNRMPYLVELVWVIWFVLMTIMILQGSLVSDAGVA